MEIALGSPLYPPFRITRESREMLGVMPPQGMC